MESLKYSWGSWGFLDTEDVHNIKRLIGFWRNHKPFFVKYQGAKADAHILILAGVMHQPGFASNPSHNAALSDPCCVFRNAGPNLSGVHLMAPNLSRAIWLEPRDGSPLTNLQTWHRNKLNDSVSLIPHEVPHALHNYGILKSCEYKAMKGTCPISFLINFTTLLGLYSLQCWALQTNNFWRSPDAWSPSFLGGVIVPMSQ